LQYLETTCFQTSFARAQATTAPASARARIAGDWGELEDTPFVQWLFGERLSVLASDHGPEGVRVVVGFDN
jgi:hypothetical protein